MPHSSISRAIALAALGALGAAPLAAQPTLSDVTFFNGCSNGAWCGGWWNTRSGDGTFDVFLSTQPNATWTAGAVVNPSTTISKQLAVGTNTFYFYTSTSPSTVYGLNLFFGNSATPAISAHGSFGNPFAVTAAGTDTESPTGGHVGASGALTFNAAPYTVTLTAFDILWRADGVGTNVNRVSAFSPTPDGSLDNYGRIVLQVTGPSSSVPEPSTWALLATGGLALAGVAARKRRA